MSKRLPWLSALVIITIIFGTIYVVSQQVLRMGANDPQIQLSEDTTALIDGGSDPTKVVSGNVDITTSLAPFVDIYNDQGQPVAGSGYFNGHLPAAPLGMLQASQGTSYSAVTWQLNSVTRIAAVTTNTDVTSIDGPHYYVVAGRQLREIEKREDHTLLLSGFGWLVSILTICATYLLAETKPRR